MDKYLDRMDKQSEVLSHYQNLLKAGGYEFDFAKQAILLNGYKSPFTSNTEKEKILLAKSSLARINEKINDLTLNYKKLLMEKEDNLNIIKKALC